MTRDDTGPSGQDPKKDYLEQGKQIASDLRDTVSKRVADNENTLRGSLGKAARWVDEKTGGKYSEQINKAESAVGDGIGRVAAQSAGTGEPQAPGATAGDGTGPTARPGGPTPGPAASYDGPLHGSPAAGPDGPLYGGPTAGGTPAAPGAAAGPPTDPPTRPTRPTRPDDPEPPTMPR